MVTSGQHIGTVSKGTECRGLDNSVNFPDQALADQIEPKKGFGRFLDTRRPLLVDVKEVPQPRLTRLKTIKTHG